MPFFIYLFFCIHFDCIFIIVVSNFIFLIFKQYTFKQIFCVSLIWFFSMAVPTFLIRFYQKPDQHRFGYLTFSPMPQLVSKAIFTQFFRVYSKDNKQRMTPCIQMAQRRRLRHLCIFIERSIWRDSCLHIGCYLAHAACAFEWKLTIE